MSKVLIIDDDRTMVSLLTTLLEMDGFDVATIRDWGAILATIEVEKPDLVLMDFFLPQIEGLEVIQAVRNHHELSTTRIVMTSGMDVSEQCMAAGANAFLLKPYTPDQLMECIQANLV